MYAYAELSTNKSDREGSPTSNGGSHPPAPDCTTATSNEIAFFVAPDSLDPEQLSIMRGPERAPAFWDAELSPAYGPAYPFGGDFHQESFAPSHGSFVAALTSDSPTDISSCFSHSPEQRGRQQSIAYSPENRNTSGSTEYSPSSYASSIGYARDSERGPTQQAVGYPHPQRLTLPSLHSPELALFSAFGQNMQVLEEGPMLSDMPRRGDGVHHSSWRAPDTVSVREHHYSSASLPGSFEPHHTMHPYNESRRVGQPLVRHHPSRYPLFRNSSVPVTSHPNATRSNSLPTVWPCQWAVCGGQYTCGALLDDTSPAGITRHLREHHFSRGGWEKTNRGHCQWASCARAQMDYASFGKHIASVHLREANAWSCEFCCRDFGRRDAMRRHMKTCPKAPEDVKPVSQASRRLAAVH